MLGKSVLFTVKDLNYLDINILRIELQVSIHDGANVVF